MPTQEDYLPPVYLGTDPDGWGCISILLPYRSTPPAQLHAVGELIDDLTKVAAAHAYKNNWTPYLRMDYGLREGSQREPSGESPTDTGDRGIPLAQLGPEESPPQGPVV